MEDMFMKIEKKRENTLASEDGNNLVDSHK